MTNLNPIRVLCVEDKKEVQWIMCQMLEMMGYQTAAADNGKIGVEKAKVWQPDVILMDVRMPVMSGPEAICILRNDPETMATPIVVLTGNADAKTRALCKQAGVDQFLSKPVDIKRVDAAIQDVLKQNIYTVF